MDEMSWGLEPFEVELRRYEERGWIGGRVLRAVAGQRELATSWGEMSAVVAGKLREPVVVGDVVALDPLCGRIEARLPRRGVIMRRRVGGGAPEQVLAANVDVAFCVTAAGADFSPRRIERLVALAAAGDVTPVVVLTKHDVATDAEVAALKTVAPHSAIELTSAYEGRGIDALKRHLGRGRTGVLLGSSGVGKSTLVNALCGGELQQTAAVRDADDKGRHTTTHRALFALPDDDGMLIDTPGLREVGMIAGEGHVEAAFPEVSALAEACRFSDCSHGSEPGCAVRLALEEGTLDAARWTSFEALERESAYEQRRQHEHVRRKRDKSLARHIRSVQADRRRRKGD